MPIRSLWESPIAKMQRMVVKTAISTTVQKRTKFSGIVKCMIAGNMQAAEAALNIGSRDLMKNFVNEKGVKRLRISSRAIVARHEIIIVTIITEYAGAPSFKTM